MTNTVEKVLPNESLEEFLATMRDFDRAFVDALASGVDFSIKMEVRGDCGEMLHAAVLGHSFRRPKGASKRIEQRKEREEKDKNSSKFR